MRRRLLFLLAVAVHLAALYWPRTVSTGGLPVDKVVHAAIFGMVLAAGLYAGLPAVPLVVLLGLHAVGSELVQHYLLPGRTGDPGDAVADVVGVALVAGVARFTAFRDGRGRAVPGPG